MEQPLTTKVHSEPCRKIKIELFWIARCASNDTITHNRTRFQSQDIALLLAVVGTDGCASGVADCCSGVDVVVISVIAM